MVDETLIFAASTRPVFKYSSKPFSTPSNVPPLISLKITFNLDAAGITHVEPDLTKRQTLSVTVVEKLLSLLNKTPPNLSSVPSLVSYGVCSLSQLTKE